MQLNARELGTVLAALRYWQRAIEQGNAGQDDEFAPIASDNGLQEPLTAGEIDELCERLNLTQGYDYAKALRAILALAHGEFDNSDLVQFGCLSEHPMNDVEEIAESALAGESWEHANNTD